jgi:hypothetical protein
MENPMKKSLIAFAAVLFVAGQASAAVPADAKYGGQCAYSLASEGKAIQTDCTVSWKDPKGMGTYCFGNEDAMKKWATDTAKNERMADEAYIKIQKEMAMGQANDAMKMANQQMDNAMKESAKAMDQANAAMKDANQKMAHPNGM